LAVRRALAVLVLALAFLAVGAIAVPALGAAPLRWVLPATALAAGSLAAGTWVRLEVAVAGLAALWLVGIGTVRYIDGARVPVVETAPFTTAGQGVALTLTLAAAAVFVARADRLASLEAAR
jgi:hypothetical protein